MHASLFLRGVFGACAILLLISHGSFAIELTRVDPPTDAEIRSGQKRLLTFYFDEAFNPFRSRVEVVGPQGIPRLQTMVPADNYLSMRTQLKLPAGHYKFHWHVQTWGGERAEGIYNLNVVP